MTLLSRAIRFVVSLAGVALVTWAGSSLIPVNATTIGFAYLLLVLVIATIWGFLEALAASIVATLSFNFFFLPPVGKLTIADPQNWITSRDSDASERLAPTRRAFEAQSGNDHLDGEPGAEESDGGSVGA